MAGGARITYNFNMIRGLTTLPRTHALLLQRARMVDDALRSVGVQTKVDAQPGPNRARAAVIAGYEAGATAESTRRNLLLALDAASDADG